MEIQAIGSAGYQAQALTNSFAAASAQSASSSSTTAGSSSTGQTYDAMDANQDGVITLQERMAYILKQAAEAETSLEESQRYGQDGRYQSSSRPAISTFSVAA